MDDRHHLGNLIIICHNNLHTQLNNLGLIIDYRFEPSVNPTNPVRVLLSNFGGISRQYHIHQSRVHAEYFFSNQSVKVYGSLLNHFPAAQSNHLFGHGIYGNGMNDGTSRSIKLTLDQGASQFEENGESIAQQCVRNMNQLMIYIETNLPDANRLSINLPAN